MSTRTTLSDPIAEASSVQLKVLLTDMDGVTALLNLTTILTALTLTHYERRTGKIINGCLARDVLGAGGGTVYDTTQTDAATNSYNVLIDLAPADTPVLTGGSRETQIALLRWTWGTAPARTGVHEVEFIVNNLAKNP